MAKSRYKTSQSKSKNMKNNSTDTEKSILDDSTDNEVNSNEDWIEYDGPLDEDIRQEVRDLAYNLGRAHSHKFLSHLEEKL